SAPEAGGFHWPDNYIVFQHYINPGTISYFFQTPYCLGFPVFFAYLALLQRWVETRRWPVLALASVLLGSLSLIQIMLFATGMGATLVILFSQWLFEKKPFLKSGADCALLFFPAVILGYRLGGMLERSSQYAKGLIVFHWPPGYLHYATLAGRLELSS